MTAGSDERHSRPAESDERHSRPEAARLRVGRRRLLLVCLALLASAAALGGAARLPWFTAGVDADGRGTVTVSATGADLVPALSAVALLALAAVAAAVALAGVARRVLGGVVALAGGGIGVAVVRLLVAPPTPADLAALPDAPAGGTATAGSATLHVGPLVAALGAVLLLVAAATLIAGERRLPRFGARYAARPARDPAASAAPVPATADPDRAAWDALDAGRDPTVEPVATPPDHPIGAGERTDGGAADRAV